MATAIYSALSGKPVKKDVAMTGEITLRGKVLPIGGLKEKSMAAYKAGVKTVIIPKENYRDIVEFDDVIKNNINFVPVETIEQVFDVAFVQIASCNDMEYNKMISCPDNKISKTKTVRQ